MSYVKGSYHVKCVFFFVCPGSPFLASEDRVLGGVIVLRCYRCVEPQPSQNIQGILGETLIISVLIAIAPHCRFIVGKDLTANIK